MSIEIGRCGTLFGTHFSGPPFRAADCAEENGVGGFGAGERVVGKGISRCINCTSAHEFVLKVDLEVCCLFDDAEDLDCFGSDFGTNAIACENADCLFRHLVRLIQDVVTRTFGVLFFRRRWGSGPGRVSHQMEGCPRCSKQRHRHTVFCRQSESDPRFAIQGCAGQ